MTEYIFDITFVYDKEDLNSLVYSLVEKYKDMTWYASDCGARSIDKKKVYSNGFTCKSLKSLKELCTEILHTKLLYIDFINKKNSKVCASLSLSTDTETETETETDTGTNTETSTETKTDTNTETGTDTDTDTNTETSTETDTETESSSGDCYYTEIYASKFRYNELTASYKEEYLSGIQKLEGLEKELNEYLNCHNNDKR